MRTLVLLGPPGAGKGTQAKRLRVRLDIPHIASGDLFRAMRDTPGVLAEQIRGYMDRGEYVPDDVTVRAVLERLCQPDAQKGWILDGFPRTVAQAESLEQWLQQRTHSLDKALLISAPTDVLVERISGRIVCANCGAIYNLQTRPPRQEGVCDVCGHALSRRTDEEPDVVRTRLQIYQRATEPVVAYYRAHAKLLEVDGSRPMGTVEIEIDQELGLHE